MISRSKTRSPAQAHCRCQITTVTSLMQAWRFHHLHDSMLYYSKWPRILPSNVDRQSFTGQVNCLLRHWSSRIDHLALHSYHRSKPVNLATTAASLACSKNSYSTDSSSSSAYFHFYLSCWHATGIYGSWHRLPIYACVSASYCSKLWIILTCSSIETPPTRHGHLWLNFPWSYRNRRR